MKFILTNSKTQWLAKAHALAEAELAIEEERTAGELALDRMKVWEGRMPVEIADEKAMTQVKVGDRVVDYENVKVKGYLSTFGNKADRQGDTVQPGAFRDTIKDFQKNPVLLRDHRNKTDDAIGGFTVLREDEKGLYVEATISNAPDLAGLRFRVAEGVLRALSIGGVFHYAPDGRTIEKVHLFEGSLVPVPANPDAVVSTRALTPEEKIFVQKHGVKAFAGQWADEKKQ